jgi:hypothetical protein
MRTNLGLGLAVAIAATVFNGCGAGRGPERVVVSGSVTYKGQPIPDGMVRFLPPPNSSMPISGAIIENGKYRAEGTGGVPVGTCKVEIEGYRLAPNEASPMARSVPRVQYLPKRYNSDSQLQITIESGSREITKDFTLTD